MREQVYHGTMVDHNKYDSELNGSRSYTCSIRPSLNVVAKGAGCRVRMLHILGTNVSLVHCFCGLGNLLLLLQHT